MKRILAAVDETPRAPRVVRTAADLAKQLGADVTLFRAIDVPPDLPPAAKTHPDDVDARILAAAERDLRELAAAEGVTAAVRVVASHEPWRAIVSAADELAADFIVVGSHGYHGLDRILGTNAARVADRAHCAVVVVHEPSR